MPKSQPPRKTAFLDRREREFLYLKEVDALFTATQNTRSLIRNQAMVASRKRNAWSKSIQPLAHRTPPIQTRLTTHRIVLAALV